MHTPEARAPVVTVVVPTAQRLAPLRFTLGTVLAQQDVDVRVVVVDDAGEAATRDYLEALGDRRVVLRSHGHRQGAAVARNTALESVDTEWVAFCDDDDLWAPTKLAEQLQAAGATGADWSCTGAVSVQPDLRIIDHQRPPASGAVADLLLAGNPIPGGGSSVLARTELVRAAGGFDPEVPASEDWELWIRLAQRAPIASVDRPLVGYRVWPGSKSRNTDRLLAAFAYIEERHGERRRERGIQPDRAGHRRWVAKQQLRSGDRRRAASTFAELARHGSPVQWGRVAAALASPRLMDAVGTWRAARRVPADWQAAASAWLAGIVPADELPPAKQVQPTG